MDAHPNVDIINKVRIGDWDSCADILAEGIVWHFFNPSLPDLQGDYVGISGLKELFAALGALTAGTFTVAPKSARPVGDELVVVETVNTLSPPDVGPIAVDVVVVWRIVDGRITEVWDIPAVFTARPAGE